jgi:hypothetical protein
MSFEAWMVIALLAGLAGAIAHFKHSCLAAAAILFGLPVAIVALLGWPYDDDWIDTATVSILFWAVLGFLGFAVGAAAVALRIVR